MSGDWADLTDDERQYLIWHNGFLDGGDAQAIEAEVETALDALLGRTDNRIQRLVFLSRLAKAAERRRDEVLADVVAERFHWSGEGEQIGGLGWNGWEIRSLASAALLSRTTVSKRIHDLVVKTYNAYKEAHGG